MNLHFSLPVDTFQRSCSMAMPYPSPVQYRNMPDNIDFHLTLCVRTGLRITKVKATGASFCAAQQQHSNNTLLDDTCIYIVI